MKSKILIETGIKGRTNIKVKNILENLKKVINRVN